MLPADRPTMDGRMIRQLLASMALIFGASVAMTTAASAQNVSVPAAVEYYQGPVVSSNRVIGLGGAFIGVAEGAEGHMLNPAAYVTRHRHVAGRWFDYDWTISWLNTPGGDAALNVAPVSVPVNRASYLDIGFNLKFGALGIGAHAAPHQFYQTFGWWREDGSLRVAEVIWEQSLGGLGVGYALFEGQLALGAAVKSVKLALAGEGLEASETFETATVQMMFGALVAPAELPWRVGARFRTATLGDTVLEGDPNQYGLRVVPERVVAPWELGVGASWRASERRPNPRHRYNEDGEPADADADRRYLLVAGDVIVTGKTERAIGIESFLAQRTIAAGESLSLGVRAGVESEVLANRARLRAGSYFEPSRYESVSGRVHATAGADLRFTLGWDWKLSAAVDLARGYHNFGLGVGFWH
jgi:hypothetical protein